jgi:hypothetical protein
MASAELAISISLRAAFQGRHRGVRRQISSGHFPMCRPDVIRHAADRQVSATEATRRPEMILGVFTGEFGIPLTRKISAPGKWVGFEIVPTDGVGPFLCFQGTFYQAGMSAETTAQHRRTVLRTGVGLGATRRARHRNSVGFGLIAAILLSLFGNIVI